MKEFQGLSAINLWQLDCEQLAPHLFKWCCFQWEIIYVASKVSTSCFFN